jgi:hypothetical protein
MKLTNELTLQFARGQQVGADYLVICDSHITMQHTVPFYLTRQHTLDWLEHNNIYEEDPYHICAIFDLNRPLFDQLKDVRPWNVPMDVNI